MTNTPQIEAALEYASRGWCVLPVYGLQPDGNCECGHADCPNKAKHPRIKNWPQEATSNKQKILEWPDAFRFSNIGIATGRKSGIIVVDLDIPDEMSTWNITTLTARTGRGWHFYFTPNGALVRNSVKKLGEGLDIRGDGGFVVAPPSRHSTGKLYEWLNPSAPVESVPPWVLYGDPIPKGKRNVTLFKVAAALRGRGESPQAILNELVGINQQRCIPPLPEVEIRRIAQSVQRYPQEETKHATLLMAAIPQPQPTAFPQSAMTGSVGELARVLAAGTEVPEEFYFAAGLTLIGSLCAEKLRVRVNVECEPRLFTVLLGESAEVKKSTALRRTVNLFLPLLNGKVEVLHGVGSAEGLARTLSEKRHVVLCYDELKALMDKASIEGSALLAITASMFEGNRWSNPTKDPKQSIQVNDGHLSLLGCCTIDTYGRMWTSEAISIGLPNRLFVVGADRKRKVAWPEEPDQSRVDDLWRRIKGQLECLPKILDISAQARTEWERWYLSLPASQHAKRLDSLGFRLMGIIAITNDKESIDTETVQSLLEILNYELYVRQLTDPIDADNNIARLEERIRRAVRARGPLSQRDLQRYTSAHRSGLWAFDQAISNLKRAGQISFENATSRYVLNLEGEFR